MNNQLSETLITNMQPRSPRPHTLLTPQRLAITLSIAGALALPSKTTAQTRPRVLLSASTQASIDNDLNLDLVGQLLTPDALNTIPPTGYLRLSHSGEILDLQAGFGHTITDQGLILEGQLIPHYENAWGWIDGQLSPQSHNWYFMAMADYALNSTLSTGIEFEAWGNTQEENSTSIGIGPNLVINTGTPFNVEVGIQARDNTSDYFIRLLGNF